MNHIGIFLRVLLGLCVGFASLFSFSLAPYAMSNRDFAFFGGGGVTIIFGVAIGALLGWVAFRLITGAFKAENAPLSA